MKNYKFLNIYYLIIICLFSLISCGKSSLTKPIKTHKTPYEIIAQSPDSDWRDLNLENSLYIQLETGTVIIEMAPEFAPIHVSNTKALVREGLFNGTSFYRVIDGFVAQGGPEEPEKLKPPKNGSLSIDSEFSKTTLQPLEITPLGEFDGYASEVGYYNGFAVGRSKDKKQNWILHCYGAFAMGRANETNSGGTELYAVIGNAQRYLDKNTTVFGRVVAGMEHLQYLKRSNNLIGPVDLTNQNTILNIQVGSDIDFKNQISLEIMDTASQSFKDLIQSRKNRKGEWFVEAKDYIDVCSVAVPSRIKK